MPLSAPHPPLARRGAAQTALFASAFAVSLFAARFFEQEGEASPWYPAAGVLLAWLLLASWRAVPLAFAVSVLVTPVLTHGELSVGLIVATTTSTIAGYLVAATVLRRLHLLQLDLPSLAWFATLAVIIAPAWSALSTRALVDQFGSHSPMTATDTWIFFVGDAIGVLTFAPVLLFLSGVWAMAPIERGLRPTTGSLEAAMMALALVAVPAAAELTRTRTPYVLLIGMLVPIVWVSLRTRPLDAAVYLCVSTSVVSIAARIAPHIDAIALTELQAIMLCSAIVAAFVVTVRYSEIRRAASLLAVHRRLAWAATHEPGSGWLNRAGLAQAVAPDAPAGRIAVFDLGIGSDLKRALGREVTDQLLGLAMDRLRTALPPDTTRGTLDHDVLAAVVPPDPVSVTAVVRRCREALAAPFVVDGVTIHPSLSIGVASAGSTGDPAIEEALFALDESRQGDGEPTTFDRAMHDRVSARAARLADLRRALAEGEIEAHFQPIVRPGDRVLLGVEALARWRHPTQGILGAADFVPVAEAAGLVVELGHSVRRALLALAVELEPALAGRPFTFSLNMSALELGAGFVRDLLAATEAHGVDPHRIVIEVTEREAIADPESARSWLSELREAGMGVSIDDFGTGHSSLAQMTDLPVTELKIDASFVHGLPSLSDDAIVRTVISLADELGYDVVVEGVETEEQLEIVRNHGAGRVQGFLTGRPMTANAISALVRAQVEGRSFRPRPGG